MQNTSAGWLAQPIYQLPTSARESLSVGGEQLSSRVHAGFSAGVGVYTRITTTGTQVWSFTSKITQPMTGKMGATRLPHHRQNYSNGHISELE